ncbi:MAG: ribosomal protein L3 N(5)-glutamine methyltransferase [Candidatus Muproteobacteria bacterium RBG_16_62_13]|uniref:Ribosomal protein L3 N(5)-glutamine methyltransferase n=1 Tax=Candidatus Muproteobacteria bacterium RBG_16_62_13 TaxID=1817756 RepID=A0A1F6T6Y5_9PROT|nr:MAG: ribosomal protein L3 N(5)-glutamine methyltransferase [Candidatus Muproteobacteria bacterium RBG_16_62_13]
MTATIRSVIDRVAGEFDRAGLHFGHGTDNAFDEAAWLVGHHAGIEPVDLEDHLDDTVSADTVKRIEETARARIQTRRPLAYLLHEAWFAGLKFFVDERVIVPRSLTAEFILERFEPWIDPGGVKTILDLCTGSGCMAIACAHTFPQARVDAVDLSPEALEVARVNVEQYGLRERVRLVRSDLFERLDDRRYDIIVSNPPYVDVGDIAGMPAEFRHEPSLALAAGDDGLSVVNRILSAARQHLTGHGILVVEVGNSREALERAHPELPFTWLTTLTGDESVFLLSASQLQ